jgi:hypothetical protein
MARGTGSSANKRCFSSAVSDDVIAHSSHGYDFITPSFSCQSITETGET